MITRWQTSTKSPTHPQTGVIAATVNTKTVEEMLIHFQLAQLMFIYVFCLDLSLSVRREQRSAAVVLCEASTRKASLWYSLQRELNDAQAILLWIQEQLVHLRKQRLPAVAYNALPTGLGVHSKGSTYYIHYYYHRLVVGKQVNYAVQTPSLPRVRDLCQCTSMSQPRGANVHEAPTEVLYVYLHSNCRTASNVDTSPPATQNVPSRNIETPCITSGQLEYSK